MNSKVRAVYAKELRDMLRDRRTLFASAVIPVLIYPLLTLTLSEVTMMAKAKLDREEFAVAVLPGTKEAVERIHKIALETPEPIKELPAPAKKKEPAPPDTSKKADEKDADKSDSFKSSKFVFQEMPPDAAVKALAGGTIRAVFKLPPDFESEIDAQKYPNATIEYDRAERVSQSAQSRLRAMLERYESHVVAERLKKQALPGGFLSPFTLKSKDIAKADKLGGSIFGGILPLIFIAMLMTGALGPAIDLTAGEKERSTLETLIGMPVRPLELIAGKFLAVATLSLGNAALNVSSFAISIKALPLPSNLNFEFPWSALPLTLLLLLPLALFFSALLLMICSFAANTKEAQIFCLPVFLIPMLGMAVVMTPGIELQGPLLIAPVINVALLIKELFLMHGTAQQYAGVFVSTCLYAAGMVALAGRVFAREEVLFSAQGSLRLFLSRRFFKPSPTPRPGDALLLAALLFPLNFYVQAGLQKTLMKEPDKLDWIALAVPLLVSLYGLFLIVPLLIAKYLKADWKTTFQWKKPSWGALAGAGMMGATSWLIAQQLIAWQSRVWDAPDFDLGKMLEPLTSTAWGQSFLLFLIAFTPAVCEEHFFRGFLQTGLGRRRKWPTILLVGAIFGLFHLTIFRLPVLFLFGTIIAYTAYRTRSIWPGVLMHFLHNGLSMVGNTVLKLMEERPVPGQPLPSVPMSYFGAALLVFVAGLWLVKSSGLRDGETGTS